MHGPNMQSFVGPQQMERQDIARLTKFHKLLLDHERVVEQGGEMPTISALRESFDNISKSHFVVYILASSDLLARRPSNFP